MKIIFSLPDLRHGVTQNIKDVANPKHQVARAMDFNVESICDQYEELIFDVVGGT